MKLEIDIDSLRNDLRDYFGSAISYNPVAVMDVIVIDNAHDEELINIAIRNGFDLNNYVKTLNL